MNAPCKVADWPLVVVTTTSTGEPALPAGVVAVIDTGPRLTMVAGAPPMVTVAPVRLLPAIVTVSPPAVEPVFGTITFNCGAVEGGVEV